MVIPLIFPKVPQSSQTESLGFPCYPLPFKHRPLKNPTKKRQLVLVLVSFPWVRDQDMFFQRAFTKTKIELQAYYKVGPY